MSTPIVAVLTLVGLFAGSAVWVVARNQAAGRPLWDSPRCEQGLGVSISPRAAASDGTEAATPEAPFPTGNACGAALPALAWLPFFGFGTTWHCPTCSVRQSNWRVVIELATALYFAIAASRLDDGLHLAAVLIFTVPLLVTLLVDVWTRLIYTNVIYAGIAAGLIFALAEDGWRSLWKPILAILAAVAIFLFFYVVAMIIYRDVRIVPFGKGDIYLAAMIAAMTVHRDQLIRALFLGIFLAGAGGVLLLGTKRVSRRQAMPYGPYLCLGALIALVL